MKISWIVRAVAAAVASGAQTLPDGKLKTWLTALGVGLGTWTVIFPPTQQPKAK